MGDQRKMKAVVYDKSAFPEVLVYREVDKPTPGDTEVLVKIHAASVNAARSEERRVG